MEDFEIRAQNRYVWQGPRKVRLVVDRVRGFEEELAKKAWLLVENVGRGKAVLFADNPLYRMFLESEHQLVLNAIVLGTGFGGGGGRYR